MRNENVTKSVLLSYGFALQVSYLDAPSQQGLLHTELDNLRRQESVLNTVPNVAQSRRRAQTLASAHQHVYIYIYIYLF